MSLTVHLALVFHAFIAVAVMVMVWGHYGLWPSWYRPLKVLEKSLNFTSRLRWPGGDPTVKLNYIYYQFVAYWIIRYILLLFWQLIGRLCYRQLRIILQVCSFTSHLATEYYPAECRTSHYVDRRRQSTWTSHTEHRRRVFVRKFDRPSVRWHW